MKILIVGDIFSKMGRASFERNLKKLKEEHKINFVIVNGENTSHGKGLNEGHYKWYMEQGVNVITLGNHSFHNRSIYNIIDNVNNLIRPLNYNTEYGKGYCTINYNGIKITVMQVIGRTFMNEEFSSPFVAAQEVLDNVSSDIYICDIHAETTSEKIAFGYHFDGKIQVIYGTHTHVQTTDARILPNGSAYITDVGFCGAYNSVIGMSYETSLQKLSLGLNLKHEVIKSGVGEANAIIVSIDMSSGVATSISRINYYKDYNL